MTSRQRRVAAAVVIIIALLLGIFAFAGKTDYGALITLLGVIAGASISELSRSRTAQLDREHQLRMASLDERLKSHQKAYSLWRRLMRDAYDPQQGPATAIECQEWWESHCLYLEPKARQAFFRAYLAASTFHVTRQGRDQFLIKAEWKDIREAGNAIVTGVELPTIAPGEEKEIGKDAESDA